MSEKDKELEAYKKLVDDLIHRLREEVKVCTDKLAEKGISETDYAKYNYARKLAFEILEPLGVKPSKEVKEAMEKWKERVEPQLEEIKKIPEGVETVKYEFVTVPDAEIAETMFDAIMTGKYEFRSAVNIGTMVRAVMYEKGEKMGTPVRMMVTDKDMAWHLQQLIDWCLKGNAKVLATRRKEKAVEVAFRMEGIKPMEKKEKEKLYYHFKKTDGWTLVGEEK